MATTAIELMDDTRKELTAVQRKNLQRASRKAWNECFSDLIEGRKNWQKFALLSWAVTGIAVGGMVHFGSLPKEIAYIAERDPSGHLRFLGKLKDQPWTEKNWDEVYEMQLEDYVRKWRSVTSDRSAQDYNWDQVYAMTAAGSQAKKALDDFYAQQNPVKRAGDGVTVRVEFRTKDREGDNTFGLWWSEITSAGDNNTTQTKGYRAVFTFDKKDNINFLVREIRLEEVHVSSDATRM